MVSSWWGTCWTSVSTPFVSPRPWRWNSPKCWWRSSVTRYQRWSQASLTRSTSTRSDSLHRWDRSGIKNSKKRSEKSSGKRRNVLGRPVLLARTVSLSMPASSYWMERFRKKKEKKRKFGGEGFDPAVTMSGLELRIVWEAERDTPRRTCDKCDKASRSTPMSPCPKDDNSIFYGDKAIHFLGRTRYIHYTHTETHVEGNRHT